MICKVCHVPVEGKSHQFTFAAERDELCFGCHEDSRDMMLAEHLHTPVANGDCTVDAVDLMELLGNWS